MRKGVNIGPGAAAIILAATLALGGCDAVGNYLSKNTQTPQIGPEGLFQAPDAKRTSDQMVKLPANAADLDCPEVDIAEGGATSRVGGDASQSVRYQFDITDVARECDPQGGQFALKVGVAGRLLIGPAGSPGGYSTTLHVQVVRDIDNKPVFDKSFSVAANTQGGSQADFRFVTDPILLPLTRAKLDADYSINVGLGGGGAVRTHHKARRRG